MSIRYGKRNVVALVIFLIALLWVSTPLHAADASGTWVIRDEGSCLSFGDVVHTGAVRGENTIEHTTRWDSVKKECLTLDYEKAYFALPLEIFTNCQPNPAKPGHYFACDGFQAATIEVPPGVTVVTSTSNWGLQDAGRVINFGHIEVRAVFDDSGRFLSDYSPDLGSGTIENHGSIHFNCGACDWTFSGTLTNEGQGGDPRDLLKGPGRVYIDGGFHNKGTVRNDATFTSHPAFSNTGTFRNDQLGTLLNLGRFENHAEYTALFWSWVERGNFENLGKIVNRGTVDLSKSPLHFADGTFDSSEGIVKWDKASSVVFHSGLKTGSVVLENAGLVDVSRHWVEIAESGSLVIGAGTTIRIRFGVELRNFGKVENHGEVQVAGGAIVRNGAGATMTNYARARIGQNSSFANEGLLDNREGAALLIAGSFANTGALNNQGAIDINCPGTITNNPVGGNTPGVTPCAPVITSAVLADPRQTPDFFPPSLTDFRFAAFPPFAPGLYATNTPTITGTVDASFGGGAPLTVTLYTHAGELAVLGTAVTDVAGQWSIVASPLSYGFHRLIVTATNAQGQTSSTSETEFIGTTMRDVSDPFSCEEGEAWSGRWEANTCRVTSFGTRADDVVWIPSGVTLDFRAWGADHAGILVNHGSFRNERGFLMNRGRIDNFGTFANVGSFVNRFEPNKKEGYLENRTGTINNFKGATLSVESLAKLSNTAALNNHGTIEISDGSSVDNGFIDLPGSILNNSALIRNQGVLANYGTMVQFCAGTVTGNSIIGGSPLHGPCAPVIASMSSGATPTMLGTSEPNVTVTLFLLLADGAVTRIGSTTATSSGTWSLVAAAPLPAGGHTLVATADNGVGRSLLSDSVEVEVVLPPPNVAPALTPPASQSAAEGANVAFALGSFTDADTDSSWAVNVTWGDGSAPANLTSTSTGELPLAAHTYSDNGVYTVTVTVADTDAASGSETFQVTVANVEPTATFGAPGSVQEGSGIALSLAGALDPSSADAAVGFTYAFDCGTGFGEYGASHTASCPTTDNGSRTVRGRVRDKDGGVGTYSAEVTILNVAPAVSAATGQNADEGASVALGLGSFMDADADSPWEVTVTWGDGSMASSFTSTNTGALPAAAHTYADDGVYTVTVSVTDKDGGTDSESFQVTVANVAPRMTAPADATIAEGGTFTATGSFVDPGADTWTATVDHGDGTPSAVASLSAERSFALDHTYADEGRYTVTVTVADDDGGASSATLAVTVQNVAPVLSSLETQPNPVDEGSAMLLSVGFTDPGTSDAHTACWSFGDGSSSTQQVAAVGARTASIQQRYADDGIYTVTVMVDDADGGTSAPGEIQVEVRNVAPRFEPSLGPRSIAEGRTLRFEVRAADASSLDELTLGAGGLPPRAAFVGGRDVGVVAGMFEWTPACDQAGDYVLTFRVQDDDGGVSEESVALSVTEACAAVVAVANEGDDTVAIVDAESQQVRDVVAVGHKPAALAFGEAPGALGDGAARVFVTGRSSDRDAAHHDNDDGDNEDDEHDDGSDGRGILAVLAQNSGGRFDWTGTIDVSHRPVGVAVTPDGAQLWVARRDDDSVAIIDSATARVLGVVRLQVPRMDNRGRISRWTTVGRRPLAVAFSPDGAFAYVIAEESNALLVLDRARALADPSGAILASLAVGKKPSALAVHPAGGLVYVATREGLAVADVSTPTAPALRRVLPLSLRPDAGEPGDREDHDDGDRGKESGKHDLNGVVVASEGGALYVTDARNDVLWVVAIQPSPEHLRIMGFVPVGRRPAGVAVTPAGSRAAGDLIYVANAKDRTVTVIDGATSQVVASVRVGRTPLGVAAAIVATQP